MAHLCVDGQTLPWALQSRAAVGCQCVRVRVGIEFAPIERPPDLFGHGAVQHGFEGLSVAAMEISFDAKPDAPATARNREPIAAVLAKVFADRRRVLEIGSGTGQHAGRDRHAGKQPLPRLAT